MVSRADPIRSPVQKREGGQAVRGLFSPLHRQINTASPETGSRDGLPEPLRSRMEALSGFAMDDVRVHHNSPRPAMLGALAFARGHDIHLAPGQERHLPHEAWHVVQQKQGRVTPTAWTKGEPINDGTALEAEADRTGESAAPANPPARQLLSRQAAAPAAIQRKIIHDGAPLPDFDDDASPYSATVQYFNRIADKFVMRDTSCPADKMIHLLESPKRYLIGEEHDRPGDIAETSRWAKAVAGWSRVTKLREGQEDSVSYGDAASETQFEAEIARQKKAAGVSLAYQFGPETPLENAHERLLAIATAGEETLKDVCSDKVIDHVSRHMTRIEEALPSAQGYLKELCSNWYDEFILAYEAIVQSGGTSPGPRLKKIYDFHIEFRDSYLTAMRELQSEVDLVAIEFLAWNAPDLLSAVAAWATGAATGSAAAANAAGAAVVAEPPETHLNKCKVHMKRCQSLAAVLASVVSDLLEIVETQGEEKERIGKRLSAPGLGKEDKILKLTSPPRERAMVANLANVPESQCPALVQIGDDHVKPVAEALGDLAVPVRLGKNLESVTRKTERSARRHKKAKARNEPSRK